MHRRRFLQGAAASLVVSSHLPAFAQSPSAMTDTGIRALIFDVFGTVVDWRTSVIREGQLLAARKGYSVDWEVFADRWRAGYGPAMNQVRNGELPWTPLDSLHRMILDQLVLEFGLTGLTEAELEDFNRVWHRLMPWPDTVAGLYQLKTRYTIATMSNGNVSLLLNMAKHAGLPWDTILSAELSGHYKPDPEAYLKAAELLGLPPERILMVAAHPSDLRAAATQGFRTAYVFRPLERGAQRPAVEDTDTPFDWRATDFLDLARQLGV